MNKSILKSTIVVSLSTLLSRIMGLLRDMIIGAVFGATGSVDAFWVAFRIPNLFRRLVAEGCLTISFIPVYTEYLVTKGESEALELAQKTLSILMVVLLSIVLAGVLFSPYIVGLFGYGFTDHGQIGLAVILNRIMFPYLFFVSIVAFAMGYLNSHKYFFAPAFSTVLLNIGFITGALVLKNYFGQPLRGLALGVILGGVLQLVFQIPYLVKAGFRMKFSLDLKHPGIRAIFRMMGPAVFGIAVYQINTLMVTMLASMLPEGSITYIYMSDRLTELVFGIFVFSLGNVILPELSASSAAEDLGRIKSLYISSIRTALFITIPAAIALIVIGLPVVSVLFMRGNFSAHAAEMTSRALAFSSIGIPAVAVVRMTVPVFYSLKDAKTPIIASAISFVVNVTLGYILMRTHLMHGGLTLALSIATTVQMLVLVSFLHKKTGRLGFKSIISPLTKFIFSGTVMGICVWFISMRADWLQDLFIKRLQYLFTILTAGIAVYFAACFVLRVDEISIFINIIINKMIKIRK